MVTSLNKNKNKRKYIIGICDDDMSYVKRLQQYCTNFIGKRDINIEYRVFSSGKALLECQDIIDILFLDIELGDENGTVILTQLCKDASAPSVYYIIFVSAHNEQFDLTYSPKTIGFLTKPFESNKFINIFSLALRKTIISPIQPITAQVDGKTISLPDIVYIVTSGSYYEIYPTEGDALLSTGAVASFLQKVNSFLLVKINRCTYVNLLHVDDFDGVNLTLSTGLLFQVGKSYKKAFDRELTYYLSYLNNERCLF